MSSSSWPAGRRSRRRPRLPKLLVFSVLAVLLSIGLDALLAWTLPPPRSHLFSPPAVYALWWQMVESCSGQSSEMSSFHWYRVPGYSFRVAGLEAGGVFMQFGNRIVIAETSAYDGRLVRHEMLHALLHRGGHPREYFLERCASLVWCSDLCLRQGGTWRVPDSAYIRLSPESLDVRQSAVLRPAELDGDRWIEQWIEVTNRRNTAVLVAAPGDARTPPTFGYQVYGRLGKIGAFQGGLVAVDSSVLFFKPFETKRSLFEFRIGSTFSEYTTPIVLPPGEYQLRGNYAWQWSSFDTVRVAR